MKNHVFWDPIINLSSQGNIFHENIFSRILGTFQRPLKGHKIILCHTICVTQSLAKIQKQTF